MPRLRKRSLELGWATAMPVSWPMYPSQREQSPTFKKAHKNWVVEPDSERQDNGSSGSVHARRRNGALSSRRARSSPTSQLSYLEVYTAEYTSLKQFKPACFENDITIALLIVAF